MKMPMILGKALSFVTPAKKFQAVESKDLGKVASDFLEYLADNPWQRIEVDNDVFATASRQVIAKKGHHGRIHIPKWTKTTVLKHTDQPDTVNTFVSVGGVLKIKSETSFVNLFIWEKGKVIGLPFAKKVLNSGGTLKNLGHAKVVENWGKLKNVGEIDFLQNASSGKGYAKKVKELNCNVGKLNADTVETGNNGTIYDKGVLNLREGGEIHQFRGKLIADHVRTIFKHSDDNDIYSAKYRIKKYGQVNIEQ